MALEQRVIVGRGRKTGEVVEWMDTFGWIRPLTPIDHPEAEFNGGRVFLMQEDVEEELEGVGRHVSFIPYADGTGIGAMDVRPTSAPKQAASKASASKPVAKAKAQAANLSAPSKAPKWQQQQQQPKQGGGNWKQQQHQQQQQQQPQHQQHGGGLQEGTLVDWRGKFGFIRCQAHGMGAPDIYVAHEDIEEEVSGVGATVSFVMYADARGMRACHVKPARRGRGRATAPATFGGRGGYYPPAEPISLDQLNERVHNALSEAIWPVVEPLAHLDDNGWTAQEMSKRVVRYLYNKGGQAPGLMTMTWQEAVKFFVGAAVTNYNKVCSEKPWFAELDLLPALTAAAFEVSQVSPRFPAATLPEVQECAATEYEHAQWKVKFDVALWETTLKSFELEDEKVHLKLHRALSGSFEAALAGARGTSGVKDLKRVEIFMKHWMEDSMCRVWRGVDDPENTLNEAAVLTLFQNLAAPNGEDDPFSCIPPSLIGKIGRPPSTWAFYRPTISALFKAWADAEANTEAKKRKKKKAADGEEDDEAAADDDMESAKKQKLEFNPEDEPENDTYGEEGDENVAAAEEAPNSWVQPKKSRNW